MARKEAEHFFRKALQCCGTFWRIAGKEDTPYLKFGAQRKAPIRPRFGGELTLSGVFKQHEKRAFPAETSSGESYLAERGDSLRHGLPYRAQEPRKSATSH